MSATNTAPCYEDLETKGYLVIKAFFSPDDIQALLSDFHQMRMAANTNIKVVVVGDAAAARVKERSIDVVSEVARHTGIQVHTDAVHLGCYFASEMVSLKLHQDHESHYAVQNLYDYLNFFVPIQKPDKAKGNLRVIPWDRLKARSPELFHKLVRRGGTAYETLAGKTLVVADGGLVAELPYDIEELCVTPELEAGDLLLLRGDVVHGTQDTATKRIALSMRFVNRDTLVLRKQLLAGGPRKTVMMQSNWSYFGRLVRAFQKSGLDAMPWRQLQEALTCDAAEQPPARSRRLSIRATLLVQRLTTGAVFPSLARQLGFYRAQRHARLLARRSGVQPIEL
jgi:Phytanoyl-CoA dioxygenase (PhyH)